jgi:hypothetical protein
MPTVRFRVHKDIFDRIQGRTGTYCREKLEEGLNKNIKAKVPKGYQVVHSQTGRGDRNYELEVELVRCRLSDEYYEKLKAFATNKDWTVSQAARNIVTRLSLNERQREKQKAAR